jgi:hypothetical protein
MQALEWLWFKESLIQSVQKENLLLVQILIWINDLEKFR